MLGYRPCARGSCRAQGPVGVTAFDAFAVTLISQGFGRIVQASRP